MFKFKDGAMYIMPVVFGPGGTPRQNPKGQRYIYEHPKGTERISYVVAYETDPEALSDLFPAGLSLARPHVIIELSILKNIRWLAGKGYNILSVYIPASFQGERDHVSGLFLPVLWENHGDPIITGREQLGFSKIFATIPTPTESPAGINTYAASWDFPFCEMRIFTQEQPEKPDEIEQLCGEKGRQGLIHYKHIPKTGDCFTQTDAAYFTHTPIPWVPPEDFESADTPPKHNHFCRGEIRWNPATWEQMPTQWHIVSKLSSLENRGYVGAYRQSLYSVDDLFDQRILK